LDIIILFENGLNDLLTNECY